MSFLKCTEKNKKSWTFKRDKTAKK